MPSDTVGEGHCPACGCVILVLGNMDEGEITTHYQPKYISQLVDVIKQLQLAQRMLDSKKSHSVSEATVHAHIQQAYDWAVAMHREAVEVRG